MRNSVESQTQPKKREVSTSPLILRRSRTPVFDDQSTKTEVRLPDPVIPAKYSNLIRRNPESQQPETLFFPLHPSGKFGEPQPPSLYPSSQKNSAARTHQSVYRVTANERHAESDKVIQSIDLQPTEAGLGHPEVHSSFEIGLTHTQDQILENNFHSFRTIGMESEISQAPGTSPRHKGQQSPRANPVPQGFPPTTELFRKRLASETGIQKEDSDSAFYREFYQACSHLFQAALKPGEKFTVQTISNYISTLIALNKQLSNLQLQLLTSIEDIHFYKNEENLPGWACIRQDDLETFRKIVGQVSELRLSVQALQKDNQTLSEKERALAQALEQQKTTAMAEKGVDKESRAQIDLLKDQIRDLEKSRTLLTTQWTERLQTQEGVAASTARDFQSRIGILEAANQNLTTNNSALVLEMDSLKAERNKMAIDLEAMRKQGSSREVLGMELTQVTSQKIDLERRVAEMNDELRTAREALARASLESNSVKQTSESLRHRLEEETRRYLDLQSSAAGQLRELEETKRILSLSESDRNGLSGQNEVLRQRNAELGHELKQASAMMATRAAEEERLKLEVKTLTIEVSQLRAKLEAMDRETERLVQQKIGQQRSQGPDDLGFKDKNMTRFNQTLIEDLNNKVAFFESALEHKNGIIEKQTKEIAELRAKITVEAQQMRNQMLHQALAKIKSERTSSSKKKAAQEGGEDRSEVDPDSPETNTEQMNVEFNRIMDQYGLEFCTSQERIQLDERLMGDGGHGDLQKLLETGNFNVKTSERSISKSHNYADPYGNEFQMISSKNMERAGEKLSDNGDFLEYRLAHKAFKSFGGPQTDGLGEGDTSGFQRLRETELKKLLAEREIEVQSLKSQLMEARMELETLGRKVQTSISGLEIKFHVFQESLTESVEALLAHLRLPKTKLGSVNGPTFFSHLTQLFETLRMARETDQEGTQTDEVKCQKYSIGVQPDTNWESLVGQTKKEASVAGQKPAVCSKCALLEVSLAEKDQLISSLGDKNSTLLESNAELKARVDSEKHKAKEYKSHLKEREADLEALRKQVQMQTHSSHDSLKESRLRIEAEERIRQLTVELHSLTKESEEWRAKFEKLSATLKQKRKLMLRELGDFVKVKGDFDNSFLTEYSLANSNGN